MSEPTYIAQSREPMSPEQRRSWIKERADEAMVKGCRWFRASVHTTMPELTLVEGWVEDFVEDQGEPRWLLTAPEAD